MVRGSSSICPMSKSFRRGRVDRGIVLPSKRRSNSRQAAKDREIAFSFCFPFENVMNKDEEEEMRRKKEHTW